MVGHYSIACIAEIAHVALLGYMRCFCPVDTLRNMLALQVLQPFSMPIRLLPVLESDGRILPRCPTVTLVETEVEDGISDES